MSAARSQPTCANLKRFFRERFDQPLLNVGDNCWFFFAGHDACRSQGCRQGFGLGTEEQQGMVTVYSCSPREASYEIEALGQGSSWA